MFFMHQCLLRDIAPFDSLQVIIASENALILVTVYRLFSKTGQWFDSEHCRHE